MNITLHLTTACPLRCRYCYSPQGETRVDMDHDTALRAVEFAAEQSPVSCGIVFFGGEPLLEKDLIQEVVHACRRRERTGATRFHFKITTSGIGLDDAFLDLCVAEEIFVALSMDGGREAHDANRVFPGGGGTYDRMADAADRLLSRRPYAPVLMTVTPASVKQYRHSVEHLVERGFRYVIASLDYTGDWTDRALSELKRQYRSLAKLYAEWTLDERKFYFSPFEVKLASHIHGENYQQERCELGRRQLSVGPDGRVYPCVQFVQDCSDDAFVIGDVWSGVDSVKRDRIADRDEPQEEACGQCSIADRCNHTCGCLNWQTTGSVCKVSPVLCAHERTLMPIVDRLGERLYRKRSSLFIQKHYNAMYPILSLIDDQDHDGGSEEEAPR
ncbi:MAG: radical SAM protein [Planctomycetota bacterium]